MKSALPYLRAQSPKFKGEIWENARRFRLVGAGYKSMPPEQDGFFDIRTANHLRGPLKALNDPDVRVEVVIGATQVLKSVTGDIWIVHLVEHESDSILCLFEDDPKAKLYASTRCMDTVKKHPVISEMIAEVIEEADRHQVQSTQIKFGGSRLLKICGLNDGNVSSLSWRFIWISEAWQHKSDGLLPKAKKRADRYAHNCKILIESQAGDAGEDLDMECRGAHEVPLTWACPYCGGRQTWECVSEYTNPRPPGFVPIKPTALPEGQLNLWVPPTAGSSAGMKIPPAEVPGQTNADGSAKFLTIEERARTAKWECYWCGTLIEDTPALRQRLMDSYEQEYRVPVGREKGDGRSESGNAPARWRTPKAVLFRLPREAARDNSFASGVTTYLKAKEAQASGNDVPLADWYKSERAIAYSPKLSQTRVAIITGSVLDPKIAIPNESFRSLEVDCQKDVVESLKQGKDLTGHFWWVAEAHDKQGNTFMLGRGYATSWEELFGRVAPAGHNGERSITGGIKNKLMIPTRNVAIDGGNWFDIVKEKAAHYRTQEAALDGSGKQVWATWKIMVGDDGKGVRWEDGVWRSYWPPKTYLVDVLADGPPGGQGVWLKIAVQVTRWSNFAVKSVLYKLRMGAPGQPKFVALDVSQCDAKTRAKEVGDFAYENQMNGFALGEDAKGKPKFIELHKQQHYPDDHCMGIVMKMMKGLVRGETAAGDGTAQEAA